MENQEDTQEKKPAYQKLPVTITSAKVIQGRLSSLVSKETKGYILNSYEIAEQVQLTRILYLMDLVKNHIPDDVLQTALEIQRNCTVEYTPFITKEKKIERDTLLDTAQEYMQTEQWQRAMQTYSKVLTLDRNCTEALTNRQICREKIDNLETGSKLKITVKKKT